MTATINGHKLTDGDDVRDCVRAPETPVQTPTDLDSGPESAFTPVHTRAIPDDPETDKATARALARDFVSRHGGEALDALDQSWLMTEVPLTAGEAWRDALPRKGEASGKAVWLAMATAGLFRALAVSLLHLFLLAVGTRMRAGVALLLSVLAVAGSCTAHNLSPPRKEPTQCSGSTAISVRSPVSSP